ncbi:MAG: hypothetical protein HY565_04600 [Candidatus Kerfeldbacteria bacterium]|nr:hypothetical protein [Candidatus Kerfeldbacteria bacterium]
MLSDFKQQLAAGYAKEKAKQVNLAKQPNSPATKSYHRKGGIMLLALGCIALLINLITYWVNGTMLRLMLAAMLGLWAVGLWFVITGRRPVKNS